MGDVLVDAVLGGLTLFFTSSGTSRRALFRLSNVTPLPNLVIPTTGGSPFLTNSHMPVVIAIRYCSNFDLATKKTNQVIYAPLTGTPPSQSSHEYLP